jgi:hypothetical protein
MVGGSVRSGSGWRRTFYFLAVFCEVLCFVLRRVTVNNHNVSKQYL